MESGFEFINKYAGGYEPETVTVIRTVDSLPDALQDFIVSETKQIAIEKGAVVLIFSLGLDTKEFAKCLVYQESRAGIERLAKAQIYISEIDKENPSFDEVLEDIEEIINGFDKTPQMVIIDGIDAIQTPQSDKTEIDNAPLLNLLSLAKRTGLPLLVSDYQNNLETGYPRPDGTIEIELLTDLQDNVQAALYKGKEEHVTTDLYEIWRVFQPILKKN